MTPTAPTASTAQQVTTTTAPSLVTAAWPNKAPDDVAQWHTSNATVVAISSTAIDGSYATVAFGVPGSATVSVTSWANDGSYLVGELGFEVADGGATAVPLTLEVSDVVPAPAPAPTATAEPALSGLIAEDTGGEDEAAEAGTADDGDDGENDEPEGF
jgi:hypothetical protein